MECEELYADFKKAAKKSGISKVKTQKIIGSMFIAAWRLKMSEGEVSGAFRALTIIVKKGKQKS